MIKRFLLLLISLSLLLTGCTLIDQPISDLSQPVNSSTITLPQNIIQIRDPFDYFPDLANGHFKCTVTDVQVVTEQSQCPQQDYFIVTGVCAYKNGDSISFEYDEWFTEGGAFDLGARLILVDLTVTNVDAVAWLDNGLFNEECGYFNDACAFPTNNIVTLIDLSNVHGSGNDQYFLGHEVVYFSRAGEFAEEDIPNTLGTENFAIKIMPGETASFTIGFFVHGNEDGQPQDLSSWCLGIGNSGGYYVDSGRFIELKFGEE